ncbi:hypothetical protein PCAR4_300017 [Paraburkholderia caribensis]|nr:hypothetical protein PCAR4_300017 [Paraburkholderia caribensis]
MIRLNSLLLSASNIRFGSRTFYRPAFQLISSFNLHIGVKHFFTKGTVLINSQLFSLLEIHKQFLNRVTKFSLLLPEYS